MHFVTHERSGQRIAEVVSDQILIQTAQDALDLMVNPGLAGIRKIVVHQHNLAPEFFQLRTGIAGEILQKFVTYQVQLAIVGDFEKVESESLRAFILECNRGHHIFFVPDVASAITKLTHS